MLKILHTGDFHIGMVYGKQSTEVAQRYREARIEALQNVIRLADEEQCDYLVIAGDLFDHHPIHQVTVKVLQEVCQELEQCACPVLVLPGNHDYYQNEEDELWKRFKEYSSDKIILLNKCERYECENAVFYPCPCHDRHSKENALAWLKEDIARCGDRPNIGIAHGALEGLSIDKEGRHYLMTRQELEGCKMDVWLLGHTHVPEPKEDYITDCRIFNAGTHQQTDISDNSDGSVFIIEIADDCTITAKKVHTGVIFFVRKERKIQHGETLESVLDKVKAEIKEPKNTTLRLTLSGTLLSEDYEQKGSIYQKYKQEFLWVDFKDDALKREITGEMIEAETMEGSIERKLLQNYGDQPELLNLAYDLICECKKGN